MNFTEYLIGSILAFVLGYLILQGFIIEPLQDLMYQTTESITKGDQP